MAPSCRAQSRVEPPVWARSHRRSMLPCPTRASGATRAPRARPAGPFGSRKRSLGAGHRRSQRHPSGVAIVPGAGSDAARFLRASLEELLATMRTLPSSRAAETRPAPCQLDPDQPSAGLVCGALYGAAWACGLDQRMPALRCPVPDNPDVGYVDALHDLLAEAQRKKVRARTLPAQFSRLDHVQPRLELVAALPARFT